MATEWPTAYFSRARRSTYGPAWRFRCAELMAASPTPLRAVKIDPLVVRLGRFQSRASDSAEGALEAIRRDPPLAGVQELDANAANVERLKIAILGGLAVEEISARLSIPAPTIELWQAIYFDVEGLEKATSWMVHWVIDPVVTTSPPLGERLRLALVGGPEAARAILDEITGLPVDEATELCQLQLRLHLKAKEALAMPLSTPREARHFVDVHLKHIASHAKLQLDRDRLAAECVRRRERHERDMKTIELELARERRMTAQAEAMRAAADSRKPAAAPVAPLATRSVAAAAQCAPDAQPKAAAARAPAVPRAAASSPSPAPKGSTRDKSRVNREAA